MGLVRPRRGEPNNETTAKDSVRGLKLVFEHLGNVVSRRVAGGEKVRVPVFDVSGLDTGVKEGLDFWGKVVKVEVDFPLVDQVSLDCAELKSAISL